MQAIVPFLLFVVVQVAAALTALLLTPGAAASSLAWAEPAQPDPVVLGITLLLYEIPLCIGLWWWHRHDAPCPCPLRPAFHPRLELPLAIAAVLLLSWGVSAALEPFGLSDDGTTAIFLAQRKNVWCVLLLCVVGPLCEELVFRKGIVRALFLKGCPGLLAAALGALSFAVVHGNWVQGIPAFVVGTLLGLLFLRTGNLRLCLPAHVANNVLALLLL